VLVQDQALPVFVQPFAQPWPFRIKASWATSTTRYPRLDSIGCHQAGIDQYFYHGINHQLVCRA
jgi:hypothetical protein